MDDEVYSLFGTFTRTFKKYNEKNTGVTLSFKNLKATDSFFDDIAAQRDGDRMTSSILES